MIDTTDAQWACHRKKRYTTAEAAQSTAQRCWERRGVSLRVYPCEHCGGHHLTHIDADPAMRPGWRPPAKSRRQLAAERRGRRRKGRR